MEKLLTVMEERSFVQLRAFMCPSAGCFGSSDLNVSAVMKRQLDLTGFIAQSCGTMHFLVGTS